MPAVCFHLFPLVNCRECKMDIEDKKQELLEMDQALKERNWELKQRAAQVGFLYYILMKFPLKIQSHGYYFYSRWIFENERY